jgi:general L-amino acid transport system permease protein
MTTAFDLAYVRKEEEPVLAPPAGNTGAVGWLRARFFSTPTNIALTILGVAFLLWAIPPIIRWAFIDAVWTGTSREACIAPGAGACWAFVKAKFAQFMYGRYTIDERWRVDLTAILLIVGVVPLAMPRVPWKREFAIYTLIVFPIVAFILLTGGNLSISVWAFWFLLIAGAIASGIAALAVPEGHAPRAVRLVAPIAAGAAILIYVATLFFGSTGDSIGGWPLSTIAIGIAGLVAALAGLAAILLAPGRPGGRALIGVWGTLGSIAVLLALFSMDFGLPWVETSLWGGLLVTLVVAIVGIVASLPLGILLALGRRSKLPIVKFASITFIEFVRGVPLITVLFMASVMLPLFLPPGVNFDKLLKALIGVALFSAAYMAEVVRGGLQAIPKGQYEAAAALGLNYARMMRFIILPQALKIVIPGIVNSFISLFKDTSLVLIIGIFDLLGIVQVNFTDVNWASPSTPATGYAFAAAVFWVFCFGMSRYSIYTERRLDTGYRR